MIDAPQEVKGGKSFSLFPLSIETHLGFVHFETWEV